jgi:hypothetical protein
MPTRRARLAIMLLVTIALPVRAEDFWGRMLPHQPVNFIFGYGSLINTISRNATSTHPAPAIPVRVSAGFGYIRAWDGPCLPASRRSACASRHPARGR